MRHPSKVGKFSKTRRLAVVTAGTLGACTVLTACTPKPKPTEVVISLDQTAQALSSATILVDYSESAARPLLSDGAPACTSILPHVDTEFTDDGAGGLTINARSAQGFSAPVDLAVCRMVAEPGSGATPSSIAAGLEITLLGAVDNDGERLDDRRLAQSRARSRQSAAARGGDGAREQRGSDRSGGEERLAHARAGAPSAASRLPTDATGEGAAPAVDASRLGNSHSSSMRTHQQPSTARPREEVLDELDDQAAALRRGDSNATARQPTSGSDDGGETANDESDNDSRAVEYAVTLGVSTDSGVLGALQFDIHHTGVSGGWLGAGASAACTPDVPVALATFNDRQGGYLSGALVDLSGIETPGRVATCTFKSRDAVDAGSFSVDVIDASTTDPSASKPLVEMAVFDVVRRN